MRKFYLIIIIVLIFNSCVRRPESLKDRKENRCISHDFEQGKDDDLYGKNCVESRSLFIKTSKEGIPTPTSASIPLDPTKKTEDALRMEKGNKVDFLNKVYQLGYSISANKGNYSQVSFLHEDFLSEKERFFGVPDTEYKIVFQALGNYLVLYKAAKKLSAIPYIERTSLKIVEDPDSYNFRVPFIGYPIEYCYATPRLNDFYEETREYRPICTADKNTAQYFKIVPAEKEIYEYHYFKKRDLFPKDFFNGQWFYTEGVVEAPHSSGERSPVSTYLITFEKTNETLVATDTHQFEETNKQEIGNIPVLWRTYEPDKNGELFQSFGERISPNHTPEANKYVQLDLTQYFREGKGDSIIDILVTPDYFSMILATTKDHPKIQELETKDVLTYATLKDVDPTQKIKYQVSFLKKDFVNDKGFSPKRWFEEDSKIHFGVLSTAPNIKARKYFQDSKRDQYRSHRMIHYNINNNEPILWYFSKNSTKESFYREIAREAVEVYNRGFKSITTGTNKHVEVKLVDTPGTEKDLGDLRYNVLNFVNKNYVYDDFQRFILYGYAPSYVNPYTGQIIGGTANIFIHTVLDEAYNLIGDYIRYEIFQKPDKTKYHSKHFYSVPVVTPYLEAKIKSECPEVQKVIDKYKQQAGREDITPRHELDDEKVVEDCGKIISRSEILSLTLHEMGHNFGLSHNFTASFDKENYYTDIKGINTVYKTDMKQYLTSLINFRNLIRLRHSETGEKLEKDLKEAMPKTSSVMDYLPTFVHSPLTVLGKYDLASLKFLYLSQVELNNGRTHTLKTTSPDSQIPISEILSQNKTPYLHCSEQDLRPLLAEQLKFPTGEVCAKYDMGSTPQEIIDFKIDKTKKSFHRQMYRYDRPSFIPKLGNEIHFIFEIFKHWNKIKGSASIALTLSNPPVLVIPDASERFNIKKFPQTYNQKIKYYMTTYPDSEFAKYQAIRNPILNFIIELLFEKAMKCKLQNSKGEIRWVDLELIKELAEEERYHWTVKNCQSEEVTTFLKEQHTLTMVGQEGVENFPSYYPEGHERHLNWEEGDLFYFSYLFSAMFYVKDDVPSVIEKIIRAIIMKDPEFFDRFTKTLRESVIQTNDLYRDDLHKLTKLYFLVSDLMRKHHEAIEWGILNTSNEAEKRILEGNSSISSNNIRFYIETNKYTAKDFREHIEDFVLYKTPPLPIESIDIPYLENAFKDYQRYQKYLSFLKHLLNIRENHPKSLGSFEQTTIQQLSQEELLAISDFSFYDFLTSVDKEEVRQNIQTVNTMMEQITTTVDFEESGPKKVIPFQLNETETGVKLSFVGISKTKQPDPAHIFNPITLTKAMPLITHEIEGEVLTIPITAHSFIAEMIQKYYENLEKIREIESKEEKTFFDKVDQITMTEYNKALIRMITKRPNDSSLVRN